jgi:predicted permease
MNWWGRLTRRDALERQLDAELRDHFERLVADHRVHGWPEAEARRRARLEFGGLDQVKELCRDVRGTRWLDELTQDARYGWRALRKHAGFTAVAITTLAIGIAATLTIFSIVEALLLRPLPVTKPDELVTLVRWQSGYDSDHFSYPQVQRLAERSDLFAGLAGIGSDIVNVGASDALEPTSAAWVSGQFYSTLGVVPLAGRLLSEADDRPGAPAVAVITHDYWRRRFGGDPGVVGAEVVMEGVPVPIVGISPPGFTGATVGERADITLAVSARPRLQPENDGFLTADARWLRIVGRRPGSVGIEKVQAGLDVIWPRLLAATLPASLSTDARARAMTMTVSVAPGANGTSRLRSGYRAPLAVATGLVALVLVLACVNVAELVLARAGTRSREIALRCAVGAGRSRIVRQLLTESALLAALGTAAGIAVAAFAGDALVALIASGESGPEAALVSLDLAFNWRVAGAAMLVMVTTTLLFGLAPALRASLIGPGALSASPRRIADSHRRLARSLIVAQVALSLALVTGAGLFARSLNNLRALDRGFRTEHVLLASFDASRGRLTSAALREFNSSILRTVEQLQGVRAASLAAITPLQGGGMSRPVVVNGVSTRDEEVYFNIVSPRFFEIMQTPVIAGRDFGPGDNAAAPKVAIVNETFVRQYLTPGGPLGQRVAFSAADDEMRIVGVVRDAVYETLRAVPPATIYAAYLQQRGRPMTLVIDAEGALAAAATAVRAAVQPKVPTQPLRMRTLTAQVEASLVRERLMALLASVFGAVALTLAAIGLYGLIAHSVTNHTHEIGVRLALGARPLTIERGILQMALGLLAAGIAIGVPATWMLAQLVRSFMFGIAPTDSTTMTAAIAVLTLAAVLAALGPARRAARIDPVISLRAE